MRARLVTVCLWTLVAVQVAIPASYYLWRNAGDDERFAWRMFSAVRLKRCKISAFDHETARDAARVELAHAVHASWVSSMTRGRRRVIERFLAGRCALPAVTTPVLVRDCQAPSGRALPPEAYRYDCRSGRLEEHR